MIYVVDSSYNRIAILKDIISCERYEELNGANLISFTLLYTTKTKTYLSEDALFEYDGNYFETVSINTTQREDGLITVGIEAEHITYRLNDMTYDLDYFAEIGTPTEILTALLDGTDFTAGTIEFTEETGFSILEKSSRRMILFQFAEALGAELAFNETSIDLLTHRGSTDLKLFTWGKNIKILSQKISKKEFDESGNPLITYECTPLITPGLDINIGDDIKVVQSEMNFDFTLRVMKYSYNPYDKMQSEFELANMTTTLSDQFYRFEVSSLTKNKIYNGCRISADEGFVVETNDGTAKVMMNATEGISVYGLVEGTLERNFFVDTDGRLKIKNIDITGSISWGASSSPVKVQYSIDGSTLWHDAFTSGDLFARYSYDGGTTYTGAVRIVGTDGTDGTSTYTYIRYSEQSDGTGFVSSPTSATKYIGIAVTTSETAPVLKTAYTWSKYQGEDADVPGYIKETYIDMRSVSSPYIIGTSIQGSDYVHYPSGQGWALYVGDTTTTNNFMTSDAVTPQDWFNVNDAIDIGTTRWGSELATGRTITNKIHNGDGTHTFVFDGNPVTLTQGTNYMHKSVSEKLFTIYSKSFDNPEIPLDDTYIIGGIGYTNLEGTTGGNFLSLYTDNGASLLINSDLDILIRAHQIGGRISIGASSDIIINPMGGILNLYHPLFLVNAGYGHETYAIVEGVSIGSTTTLIRLA